LGGLHRNEKWYKTLLTVEKVYTLQKSAGRKINDISQQRRTHTTGPSTPTETSHAGKQANYTPSTN